MTLNITNDVYCDYYGNYIITELNRTYHFGKCYDAELNKLKYEGKFLRNYAAGGYGYVLSRKSMFYIINNKNYIYSEIYEDKAIGDVLCKNNIKLTWAQNVIKHRNNKVKINLSTNYKCAVIMFHKNKKNLWLEMDWKKCKYNFNQTITDFDIFEINYGGDDYSLFEDIYIIKIYFLRWKLKNTYRSDGLFIK